MRTPDIAEIAALLATTDITEFDLRGPGTHIHLRHPAATSTPAVAPRHTVTAPSLGVFLHRHPLHDTPLAPTGTAVSQGQLLGLLRIGALLLPVTAPIAATVAGFWAEHDSLVGYGADLVELHPTE